MLRMAFFLCATHKRSIRTAYHRFKPTPLPPEGDVFTPAPRKDIVQSNSAGGGGCAGPSTDSVVRRDDPSSTSNER